MTKCCNPEIGEGGGWGIFNALFGWTNTATYGSVISYNLYWIVVIIFFLVLRYKEQHGHVPFMHRSVSPTGIDVAPSKDSTVEIEGSDEKRRTAAVREVADLSPSP